MSADYATGNGHTAIAIVGLGAVLPDAPNAPAFWQNIAAKRYSITEVPPERWRVEDYYDLIPDKTKRRQRSKLDFLRRFARRVP